MSVRYILFAFTVYWSIFSFSLPSFSLCFSIFCTISEKLLAGRIKMYTRIRKKEKRLINI